VGGREDGLRVGLIGAGRIGAFHAGTLQGLGTVASLTIADAAPGRAEQLAGEVGAEAAPTSEALLDSGVDAVVIACATPGHAPSLRLAAQAGVPAFCEKPVALDLATIDAVIDDVERAGILVQVGFQRRFDEGYRAAREAVATGAVGRVLVMRAATHDPSPPAEEYIAASGGIFRDLHIHDFDAFRFVSGEEITEIYADGAVVETPWFEQYGDVDAAAAVGRLSGGGLFIVSGTRHDPLGYDVRLEVFGTADTISAGLDGRSPIRSLEPGAPRPQVPAYSTFLERFEPAYREELAVFVQAVRNGEPSPCPLEEARAALSAALAADRSRSDRRPVSVEGVGLARTPSSG
jgi:myo-inositol 2-dehydrogenase / D-chiro-inositol 1-dehydrogenase